MGEVYRATDTKLRRDVVLKILPLDLVHNARRLQRFERDPMRRLRDIGKARIALKATSAGETWDEPAAGAPADGGLLFVVHPTGTSPGRLVVQHGDERTVMLDLLGFRILDPRYSPTGHIVYERTGLSNEGLWAMPYSLEDRTSETGQDVFLLDLDSGGKAVALVSGPADENAPAVSPDDRHFLYVSDETGRKEAYLRVFPSGAHPLQVSLDGSDIVLVQNWTGLLDAR